MVVYHVLWGTCRVRGVACACTCAPKAFPKQSLGSLHFGRGLRCAAWCSVDRRDCASAVCIHVMCIGALMNAVTWQ